MPYYPPLHMPKLPEADRGLIAWLRRVLSFPPMEDEEHLLNQIKVRDPIPTEVWGDDPSRARFGREVAETIGERIGWPNGHFVPEDPFEWAVYVIGGEDLEHTELAMALEENCGFPIEECEWEMFMQWTLGEVVDYLRSGRTVFGPDNLDCRPMSLSGPLRIEAKNCPKLAAFIEIRRLMNMRCADDKKMRVTPSTNVRELDESNRRRLDWFISSRFGTGITPVRVYNPMQTAFVSLLSTLAASLLMGLFAVVLTICFGANFAEMVWSAGWSACVGAIIGTSVLSLELLSVIATRDYWCVRSTSYRRVQTLGELVGWVVERRAALLAQP